MLRHPLVDLGVLDRLVMHIVVVRRKVWLVGYVYCKAGRMLAAPGRKYIIDLRGLI